MKRICVYCGSRSGRNPKFAEAARETGRIIAERGYGLVYGGGKSGLMGMLADACLDAGGSVTGVVPEFMDAYEAVHTDLDDLRRVTTMHERKHLMSELADAFIALPGGIGTLEEILEQMAWYKLERHRKRCGVLNTDGYFDPFLHFLEHVVQETFYSENDLWELMVADSPPALLDTMQLP